MVSICFYFQIHQPFRFRKYRIFDIGKHDEYFDDKRNKEIFIKVAHNCYLPTNQLLLDLIEQHGKKFKIAFSISGVAIEQMEKYAPQVLESFQKLAQTGCVEFLSETYYHSLSFLYSKKEFKRQIELHDELIKKYFNQTPKIFRNTELIYSNDLAKFAEEEGYLGVLCEGWEKAFGMRTPNHVYEPYGAEKIALLAKNYKFSDDIAFRFSSQNWEHYPLTAQKYTSWINELNDKNDLLNLFMDYETFGEHQKEETGIFDFLRELPFEILKDGKHEFVTPSEAIAKFKKRDKIDIPYLMSWADSERDLSAWLGNKMQKEAIREVFELEEKVKQTKDKKLIQTWRHFTTSDHYYYMSTKTSNEGIIHNYFSIYESPYDGYVYFMNALNDLIVRINLFEEKKQMQKDILKEPKKTGFFNDIKQAIKG